MKIKPNSILNVLEKNTVISSQNLIQEILRIDNQKEASIRKKISRMVKEKQIYKLNNINLKHNQKIYYLAASFGSIIFWKKLVEILIKENSVYGHCIIALLNNNGILSKEDLQIQCGSPEKLKKQTSFISIFHTLEQINLIKTYNDYIFLNLNENDISEEYQQQNILKLKFNMFISIITFYLRRFSLVSFNAVKYKYKVSNFYWDITAPSFINSLMRNEKCGFVVADYIHDLKEEFSILPFIHKVDIVKNTYPHNNIMFFLFSYEFLPHHLRLLRSKGISPVALKNFINIENSKQLYTEPTEVYNQFVSFSKTNKEIFSDMKGKIFEFFTYMILHSILSNSSIKINYILYLDNDRNCHGKKIKKEIDFFCENQDDNYYIECKNKSRINQSDINQLETICKYIQKLYCENGKRLDKNIHIFLLSFNEINDQNIINEIQRLKTAYEYQEKYYSVEVNGYSICHYLDENLPKNSNRYALYMKEYNELKINIKKENNNKFL
ncbi:MULTISPECIES: hypothetical protein [unclassified Commensalibacter]|uniref:hypothetical protein n=1 Tax=unclassified Commensalibacter TaxID=2630218 RepID=UPI0018DBD1E0|nr:MULTISPECIES: hypothetical protein [unclassified Commensalibacter]MBH9970697.1 hypothetical protein [Commensalibacter sp. M0265]MBH9978056.1 hypothetical protein [Commensalibacter sp. M0266]MBI0047232.1 hypothetical protein [Commensalibacter sp. M0267]MBI0056888.1 hypothetical protein [Commensalibacter sp. M0268]